MQTDLSNLISLSAVLSIIWLLNKERYVGVIIIIIIIPIPLFVHQCHEQEIPEVIPIEGIPFKSKQIKSTQLNTIQIKSNQIKGKGKTGVPGGKPLRAE